MNTLEETSLDLDEVLNTNDPPKFIKLENVSYYSNLSEKYELYEKWDSKWENEMWINTASIISLRKIKDNLHSINSIGEWNAFSEKAGFSIILSSKFVDSLGEEYESVFLKRLDALVKEKAKHLVYIGDIKINIQQLLEKNELIVTQFGSTIRRKRLEGDLSTAILNELENHFSKFNKTNDE